MTARRSVLLADDDPVARLLAAAALESAGFSVVSACDGLEALQQVKDCHPDCVILDVEMPVVDGLEACRRLRSSRPGHNVPVLVLTSHRDADSVGRAFDAGATDFLTKGSGHRLLTERVRFLLRAHDARASLQVSEARLRHVQQMAGIGHWEVDGGGKSLDLSDTVQQFLEGTSPETDGIDSLRELLGSDERHAFDACLAAWRNGGEPFQLAARLRHGRYVHIQGATTEAWPPPATPTLTLAIQDVTALREAEDRAYRLSRFDPLTGLPNRQQFVEELDTRICGPQSRSSVAVMAVRVHCDEQMLQAVGQAAMDRAVISASRRILVAAFGAGSSGDLLAHLGGGHFALALPGCDESTAENIAGVLLAALSPPVEGHPWPLALSTQIGIACRRRSGAATGSLLEEAEAAASRIASRDGYAFFRPDMVSDARRRLAILASLRQALERDEFKVAYQPRIDLAHQDVVGAEALLRWNSAALGDMPASQFVRVAEEDGLIGDIGAWVLDRACREAASWQLKYGQSVTVSVNVSPHQLARPRAFVRAVEQALAAHELPAGLLELELTESLMIQAEPELLDAFQALRAAGVKIALDDFGTGYSSLGYLRKLPVDCLKIDRAFVAGLVDEPGAQDVLSAILGVAAALRLRTVAEGVETVEQFRLLRARGCHEGQGFFFHPALEANDFRTLLAKRAGDGLLLADAG